MTDRLDFAALYRDLGIAPGCSPAQLRAAWRRRVSRLHPDQGGDTQDTGQLQQLNRLYRAALDFQRLHGRLPGASGGDGARPVRTVSAPWPDPASDEWTQHRYSDSAPGNASLTRSPASEGERIPRSFLLVAVIGIAVLTWRVLSGLGPDSTSRQTEHDASAMSAGATASDTLLPSRFGTDDGLLEEGMHRDAVLAIQGEPLDRHQAHWFYGPSWVQFACDRVVDWYSSPLQPLRVRRERPADMREAAEGCAD